MSSRTSLRIKQRRQWLVRSGSFLRTYVEARPDYVVRRLIKPAELGIVKLEIRGARVRTDAVDFMEPDIHCWS